MRIALLAIAWLSVSACATVVRGTKDVVDFESTPVGATATAESLSEDRIGPYDCITPCKMQLKRNRDWRVDFTLEGYKPASGVLESVVSGGGLAAGAGNALIGGLIGVGIDAGTGANKDLTPNPIIAVLVPVDSPEDSRVTNARPAPEAVPPTTSPTEEAAPAPQPELPDAPVAPPADPQTNIDIPDEPTQTPDAALMSDSQTIKNDLASTVDDADPLTHQVNELDYDPTPYKPGEVAPHDEMASDLNRQLLNKIRQGD